MQIGEQKDTVLKGQVAIVTGASSGIGEATAEELIKHGVNVVLSARRKERLSALAKRLRGEGYGDALVIPGDVRDPEYVQSLVNKAVERWGRLDIVFANAGVGYRMPVVDGDVERWKDLLDTNVYGLLLTLKYGVRALLEHGGGRGHVIVTSSIAGRTVTAGGGIYSGTKVAVNAIAEALRQEVGPDNIRVTAIAPGAVTTDFIETAGYTPEVQATVQQLDPIAPKDIANAVLYVLEQPGNVDVSELVIYPTRQTGLSFLAPKR